MKKNPSKTTDAVADRIGTTQSVISDLESAEYQGHSVAMLRRIAKALGMTVAVKLVDAPGSA